MLHSTGECLVFKGHFSRNQLMAVEQFSSLNKRPCSSFEDITFKKGVGRDTIFNRVSVYDYVFMVQIRAQVDAEASVLL